MYSRLYISVKDQGVTPNETAMEWNKMKKSFDDLIRRYPAPKFKNLYASYACFARDNDAFAAAIRRISSHELDPEDWLSGNSYEACMRWAAI